MIEHIYHIKPTNMKGSILYPMQKVMKLMPAEFAFHAKKYGTKREILDAEFPLAGCTWQDMIHCSPVDVSLIVRTLKEVFEEAGQLEKLNLERYKSVSYFKIPVAKLEIDSLYTLQLENDLGTSKAAIEEVTAKSLFLFKESETIVSDQISKSQMDYFQECAANPKKLRSIFSKLPVILYKNQIELSDCEELEVSL